MKHRHPRNLALTAAFANLLCSCNSTAPSSVCRTIPASERNVVWKTEIKPTPAFEKERAYIAARRKAADVPSKKGTVALCFSGGGLPAGTVQLGVLQGLEEADLLRQADYLSSVSGGSYISSWFVSHLLPPGEEAKRSVKGLQSYTADRRELLQLDKIGPCRGNPVGAVDELEENRGFVLGEGNVWFWSGILPAAYTLAAPFNMAFDVLAHFKPTRGKFNTYHLSYFYEHAIRSTYLREPEKPLDSQADIYGFFKGKAHELRLSEINPMGSSAPYLVLNSAMANSADLDAPFESRTMHFEFGQYSVGAPLLGYIPAEHFGFPVLGVEKDSSSGSVAMRSNSVSFLPFTTKPMRLSMAVAASGAALDSNGRNSLNPTPNENVPGVDSKVVFKVQDTPVGPIPVLKSKRLSLDFLLKPLNLNLRQQNRNFAMLPPRGAQSPWSPVDEAKDRGREITKDRFFPTVESNTLILTDGGHFDNLGVFAMTLRPDVSEIWSFDAAQDKKFVWEDINRLEWLLYATGWKISWDNGRSPRSAELVDGDYPGVRLWKNNESPVFTARLVHKSGRTIRFYFVKRSYRATDGIGRKYRDDKGVEMTLDQYFAKFRSKNTDFPQIGTMTTLRYTREQFNMYRELGRILGLHLGKVKREGAGR